MPEIPELDKPLNAWCRHATLEGGAGGCGIYRSRPGVCRSFRCGWLDGLGGEQDRPDRLGVMWQQVKLPNGESGLGVVEARPGALQSERVQRQLAQWTRTHPGRVMIREASEPRFSLTALTIQGEIARVRSAEPHAA